MSDAVSPISPSIPTATDAPNFYTGPKTKGDLGAEALGAADAGTFGAARYIAHLLGSKAFEKAEAEQPESYQSGQTLGNLGSALVPGVNLVGKGLEAAGTLGKGSQAVKALGQGIQNLGKSGSFTGMAARGAAEGAVNTEAHNIGNELTGREDENGSVLNSALMGGGLGVAGSVLGGLGKNTGKLAQAADDTSLGYVGIGQRQLLNRVKNPTSNANSTSTMNNIMDVKQRTSDLLDKYGFFKKDPTVAANEMQADIKANFQPFDQAVQADPRGFINGLTKNWQDQVGEIQNSKWASQKTKMGGGLVPVLDVGRDILSPTAENGILNDIASRVRGGGNLFDVRNLARSNAIDAFKTFSRTQDPIDGLQWDAWNRLGKSIDDTVDDMASGLTDKSIRKVGQEYGDAQMIADGLAHKEASVKLGGNSATFGRGALSALMTGRGNPIADFVSQIGGSYIEKGTAGLGARIAHAGAAPLRAASDAMNTPVANGMTAGDILKSLSGPGSQFSARLAPNLPGITGLSQGQNQESNTPQTSPPGQGPSPFSYSQGPMTPLGGGSVQNFPGRSQNQNAVIQNPYEGMQNGQTQNPNTGHYAVTLAHLGEQASSGNKEAQNAFHTAIMNGLENQWNANPYYKTLLGPATMDNPQFAKYVQGAVWNMTNHGTSPTIQPDKAGQYLFLDPGDQEKYSKGIQALRTINMSLPEAQKSTGFAGMANQFLGGMLDPQAINARGAVSRAMEELMTSQGGISGGSDIKDSVSRILNMPLVSPQSRAKMIYDLLKQYSPQAYNLVTQSGIKPESLR